MADFRGGRAGGTELLIISDMMKGLMSDVCGGESWEAM